MPTPTYTLIQEQVLGSAAATVTFSSIPGTYKDLVLECSTTASSSGSPWLRFNSDTSSNYSRTQITGNATTAASNLYPNETQMYFAAMDAGVTASFAQIMSYANTNVNKTVLGRGAASASFILQMVGLWRSTSAVTSITIGSNATSYSTGSTFRLWGVAG